MRFYRVYRLDRFDSINQVSLVKAASDAEIMEALEDEGSDHGLEIWDRTRLVGKIKPVHVSAPIAALTAAQDVACTLDAT